MGLIELGGGNLYRWHLSIKQMDKYQHRGVDGKSGSQM